MAVASTAFFVSGQNKEPSEIVRIIERFCMSR